MATKKKPLVGKDLEKKLKTLSDWHLNKKQTELSKLFVTESFIKGLAFAAKVAVHAEVMNHHPDILLSYKAVTITLTTHDVKGLTTLDFDLAKRIDKLQSD